MSLTLEQKKKNRYLFLQKLYDDTDGNENDMLSMWEVGKELGFSHDQIKSIVDYLTGENLVEPKAMGGLISLTHWGIKEIEDSIENPDKPTEHFPAVNIVTNIGTMSNSILQQGTSHSTVNFQLDQIKGADLGDIITSLKTIQESLGLSKNAQLELTSEIETIESQRKSPNPKSVIITESLKTIRTILEAVASNAMTPIIIEQITKMVG
jgi:hypothetical protein